MAYSDILMRQYPHGIIRKFPRAFSSLVATSATFAAFYTLSTGKHAIILSISAYRAAGNATLFLLLGEGTTQLMIDRPIFPGQLNSYSVDDGTLTPLEFETSIAIATDANAAASPNDVRVEATIFEF